VWINIRTETSPRYHHQLLPPVQLCEVHVNWCHNVYKTSSTFPARQSSHPQRPLLPMCTHPTGNKTSFVAAAIVSNVFPISYEIMLPVAYVAIFLVDQISRRQSWTSFPGIPEIVCDTVLHVFHCYLLPICQLCNITQTLMTPFHAHQVSLNISKTHHSELIHHRPSSISLK
jgi:hypothetical protein